MKLIEFVVIIVVASIANGGYVYSQTTQIPKEINPKPEIKNLQYQPLRAYSVDKNFCKCIDPTGKIIFTNMRYLKEQVGNCIKTELDLTETSCD